MAQLADDADLWHSPEGDPWATFTVGDHKENAGVRTKGFRRWLVRRYYDKHSATPGSQAVQEVLSVLEGRAVFDGSEHAVYVRVAEHDGRLYIDLANALWEAVEITIQGWRVVSEPPVKFARPRGVQTLPDPIRGGSIEELKKFLTVKGADWILIKSWLIGALAPMGPYPILVVPEKVRLLPLAVAVRRNSARVS